MDEPVMHARNTPATWRLRPLDQLGSIVFGAVISGIVTAGGYAAGTYLPLVVIVALTAIFTRDRQRREAALRVLAMLLLRRENSREVNDSTMMITQPNTAANEDSHP